MKVGWAFSVQLVLFLAYSGVLIVAVFSSPCFLNIFLYLFLLVRIQDQSSNLLYSLSLFFVHSYAVVELAKNVAVLHNRRSRS